MTRMDHCDITVVLDRSGSMANIAGDVVGGFQTFIEEQRKLPGSAVLTLVQFDSHATDVVYTAKPLADVPKLELVPRGCTPLLDALGNAISAAQERIQAMLELDRPGRVLIVAITDGIENASREWTRSRVAARIKDREAAGWGFVYLGVGFDAYAESSQYGFTPQTAKAVSTPSGAMRVAHMAAASYRSSGNVGLCPELGCTKQAGHLGDHSNVVAL